MEKFFSFGRSASWIIRACSCSRPALTMRSSSAELAASSTARWALPSKVCSAAPMAYFSESGCALDSPISRVYTA